MFGFFQNCIHGKEAPKTRVVESPRNIPWIGDQQFVFSPDQKGQPAIAEVVPQSTVDTEDDYAADFLFGLELAKSDDEGDNVSKQTTEPASTETDIDKPVNMEQVKRIEATPTEPEMPVPTEPEVEIDENQAPPQPAPADKPKSQRVGIHQRALAAKRKRGRRSRPALQAK